MSLAVAATMCWSAAELENHDLNQVLFLGRTIAWPLLASDCLYSETCPFGLSDFGFLASLLPFSCPFAIAFLPLPIQVSVA